VSLLSAHTAQGCCEVLHVRGALTIDDSQAEVTETTIELLGEVCRVSGNCLTI